MRSTEDSIIFDRDFETKRVHGEPVGRLFIGNAHPVRMYLMPKGLMLSVPKSALIDGTVHVYDDTKLEFEMRSAQMPLPLSEGKEWGC